MRIINTIIAPGSALEGVMESGMPCRSSEGEDVRAAALWAGSGRWYAVAAVVCIAFLAFVGGSFAMYVRAFPAEPLRRAFQGGVALYDRELAYNNPLKTDFWQPARTSARGVIRHDAARAQAGLTLYTSGHDHRAFLIDMTGRVVHEWHIPYSQVWQPGAGVKKPRPDRFIYIEKAHVFPNGDLLALYTAIGDTPWGYGLVKVDRNSRPIWRYFENAHHDFTFDPAGNIYVLTHRISQAIVPQHEHLTRPRIDDFVVRLSPDGQELGKLWLINAFAQSRFGRRLHFGSWQAHASNGDYLHANSVHVLTQPVAGMPGSRAGHLLVSLRELSTLALFDMENDRLVSVMTGPWIRQHDAEVLPSGRILLFDNEGGVGGPGRSRVLEFDPPSLRIEWSYGDHPDEPLDSVTRSSQNRLANGNTLIVESMAGRVLEVTPEGDVVWEFVNPVRGGPRQNRVPIIFWVDRLDPTRDFTPAFRDSLGLN